MMHACAVGNNRTDYNGRFRTSELLSDWDRGKPVAGHLKPEDAMRSLAIFEGKFQRLQDDRSNLIKAKEALELADSGVVSPSEERVQVSQNYVILSVM